MTWKIISCLINLCWLIAINCDKINQYAIYDNETFSKILILETDSPRIQTIVTCFKFDALNHIRNIPKPIVVEQSWSKLEVIFVNCFNNQTDHDNYRYFKLQTLLDKIVQALFGLFLLKFENNGVGLVDGRVFYGDFNFAKYSEIYIWYVRSRSSAYLGSVYNADLELSYIDHVDFNNFLYNTIPILKILGSFISNFTRENLAKFITIHFLSVTDFKFDDCDALNVPNLFEHNRNLLKLDFSDSKCSIRVHENVFKGLQQLVHLILNNLRLETIPKSLLDDLPKLVKINLEQNNIIQVDSEMFRKCAISAQLRLGGTGMFGTEHAVNFELPGDNFLMVHNENIHNFQTISSLILNPKITKINFDQCKLKYFDLSDFNEIKNRAQLIQITITRSNIKLSLAGLRLRRINYLKNVKLSKQQLSKLNANINIDFTQAKFSCPQCVFDMETFMMQLNGKLKYFNLYLIESNVIIYVFMKPVLDLIRQYRIGNTENCPAPCKCYLIPLIDELLIDCADRLLTEIPIIPYSPQIDRIDSIEFWLQNNLLTVINFTNQDDRIVERLQFVDFMNQTNTWTGSWTSTWIELDETIINLGLANNNCGQLKRQRPASMNITETTMEVICEYEHYVERFKNSFQFMMKNKPMNSIVHFLTTLECDWKGC